MEYVVVEKDEGKRERMAVEIRENPQGNTTIFTHTLSHQHNYSFCPKKEVILQVLYHTLVPFPNQRSLWTAVWE